MSVTLKELALEAGVSAATLSKVINNRPGVSDEVRAKLLVLLEEKGYWKRDMASVWENKGAFVNLVLRNNHGFAADPFYAIISEGVTRELQKEKIGVRYYIQPETTIGDQAFDEIFKNVYSVGNILIGADFAPDVFSRLEKIHTPTVLVDCVHPAFSSVNPDHFGGAKEAAAHLLAAGHRRLLFLAGPLAQSSIAERYRGCCAAAEQAGAAVQCVECRGVGIEDGEQAVCQLSETDCTALFAATDKLALGALKALRRRGLRVPQDLSVMGFDDMEWSRYAEPPLSTVHVPKTRLGKLAAQLLMNLLQDPGMERVTMNISTRLVLRGSIQERARQAGE